MEDAHLSLETLARWLAGELEHDEVLREVAPHLVASCAVCGRLREEIRRLQDESGHWNEVVAVLETREAPALAAQLESRPQEERMRLASEDQSLHTWGLCQYFLRTSREAVFQDPAQAVDRARLAVRLSDHLGESYHPDWIRDLRARAYADLGNAYRVLGELKGAEHAFSAPRSAWKRAGPAISRCGRKCSGSRRRCTSISAASKKPPGCSTAPSPCSERQKTPAEPPRRS